jgi:hypothetical protein
MRGAAGPADSQMSGQVAAIMKNALIMAVLCLLLLRIGTRMKKASGLHP